MPPKEDLAARWLALLSTAFATVMLAWAAYCCLRTPLQRGAATPRQLAIDVPAAAERAGATGGTQVWIREIVADGRTLRPGEIERSGAWETSNTGLWHVAPEPARLGFAAGSAVVRFLAAPWCGQVRIGAPDALQPLDLASDAPAAIQRFVDLPPVAPSALAWLPFALVAAAAWALARPWSTRRRTDAWLLGVLAAAHVVVLLVMPVGTVTDSLDYLRNFRENLQHGVPTYFPPGYGLLHAVLDALPGEALGGKIVLLQHALMVAGIAMLWRLLRDHLSWTLATVWLAAATWLSPTLLLPQAILSENVALFAMVGALWFGERATRTGSVTAAVLAGLCLGYGTLARVVPLVACGPALLLLLTQVAPRRRALRLFAILFGTAALWVVVPLAWFAAHGGPIGLSTGVGRHLFNRVVHEQKLLDPDGARTAAVRALLPDVDPTAIYHWDLQRLLLEAGAPDPEVLITGVATEALRTAPLRYLGFTFPHAWRNLVADPTDYLGRAADTPVAAPAMETPPLFGWSAGAAGFAQALDGVFRRVWPPLCWLLLAGAAAAMWLPQRRRWFALLWVPAGYMLTTAAVEYFLERYNVAITPLVAAGAMLPFAAIARRVGPRPHPAPEAGSA